MNRDHANYEFGWSDGPLREIDERPSGLSSEACGEDEAHVDVTLRRMQELRKRAEREPIDVDISDYGDEWCDGFLAGQANALDAVINGPIR